MIVEVIGQPRADQLWGKVMESSVMDRRSFFDHWVRGRDREDFVVSISILRGYILFHHLEAGEFGMQFEVTRN